MEHPENAICHLCAIRDDLPGTAFASLLADEDSRAQVLLQDSACLVVIDVAPIGPGHCIIVPSRHRLSLAQTSDEEKSAILGAMSAVGSSIEAAFSRECVFFEHGQCVEGSGTTGCGISHAHLHALARREGVASNRVAQIELEPVIGGIRGLDKYRSDAGYLFVQDADGHAFASRPSGAMSGVLREHFAWPEYLADISHARWSWSDHVTYAPLTGTASRVRANLKALASLRVAAA